VRCGGVLLLWALVACGDNVAVEPDAGSDAPPWSIVVLPDTQQYAERYPDIFVAQTRWIAEHAAEWNVRYALHVGDVTEWSTDSEWALARRAFAELDGAVPLAVVPGNHDYDLRQVRSSPLTSVLSPPTSVVARFDPTSLDNAAHGFEVDGERWLIVGLEWGPRPEVLGWAAGILDEHPDHRAIVLTHAYLFLDDTRYDWARKGRDQDWNPHGYTSPAWPDVTDGEEIWQRIIAPRDQVRLVVCGHAAEDGVGRLTSRTDTGRRVHQLLANYQSYDEGGDGRLRILTFVSDRIEVRTYSPWTDTWYDDAANRFDLPRD
jgi:hypothetical protein